MFVSSVSSLFILVNHMSSWVTPRFCLHREGRQRLGTSKTRDDVSLDDGWCIWVDTRCSISAHKSWNIGDAKTTIWYRNVLLKRVEPRFLSFRMRQLSGDGSRPMGPVEAFNPPRLVLSTWVPIWTERLYKQWQPYDIALLSTSRAWCGGSSFRQGTDWERRHSPHWCERHIQSCHQNELRRNHLRQARERLPVWSATPCLTCEFCAWKTTCRHET